MNLAQLPATPLRLLVAVTQIRPAERAPATGKRTLADLAHGPEAIRLLVDAVLDYAIFLIGPDGRATRGARCSSQPPNPLRCCW